MSKPSNKFDYERASRALAQAALEGDQAAAQAENLSVRTIQRYRRRMDEDQTLSQLVAEKKARLETEWAHEIAPTLRAALKFLQRAATALDPRDPDAVHAVAGAFKLVNEGHQTVRVIDARLADLHRPNDAVPGQVATQTSTRVN